MKRTVATGASLGLKKGDLCINRMGWACKIISDARTFAPCCEVWGPFHELGSVYASELRVVDEATFNAAKAAINSI